MRKSALYIFLLFWFSYLPAQHTTTLTLAVTTDVHGAFFPADWFTGEPINGSLAQVATWVKEQRMLPGQELILLDNGDLIQGDPASYYSNYIDTTGPHIAARILNYLGYDAATAGNHDIETGHRVYDKMIRESAFPWMAANAVSVSTGDPYFRPYTLIRRAGMKIAVIGMVTPRIPDWLPETLWSGLEFRDMIESARYWVKRVQQTEHPDLIIGLFHAGTDPSYGNQSAQRPRNENASRLVAEQVAGFDIIFTGHDHRHWNLRVPGPEGDSVLILGSESRAEELAVARITHHASRVTDSLSRVTRHASRTFAVAGEHESLSSYPPDPDFMSHFSGYIDTIQHYVDQPVGYITKTVSTEDAYFGPSGFTDLIHRAQLELTGADISFAAPLSFRATLAAGELKVRDLFSLYRYENQLCTLTLSGRQILGYLNYSYSLWMKQMSGPGDLMLNMQEQPDGTWRFRNASYNFDSAMGIDYVVDLSRPVGDMIVVTRLSNGQPFDPDREYAVVMNSYRASGGGNHLSVGAGIQEGEGKKEKGKSSDVDFRYLLMEWIREQGTVDPVAGNNWKVVPEEWIRAAAPRDRARLFNPPSRQR